MKNHYSILNINDTADLNEIKKAYRKAVHLYHPDANGGVGDPEKFKEVVKAYNYILKNYKSIGIKPVKAKRKAHTVIYEKITGIFKRTESATTYAKNQTPNVKRKTRKDEFANLDPAILKLPFDELKMRFTESENDFVRCQAARALTHLFGAGAIPLLKQELPTAKVAAGEEIILCLGLIGDRESILLLEQYLRHPEVKLSCAAVRALQTINQGYASILLEKIEREGRALGVSLFHFFDTIRTRRLIRSGAIRRSEVHIARFLHIHTGQPVPLILRELGFVIPD